MQCKDIPEIPVLEFIRNSVKKTKMGCSWFSCAENSVSHAMPNGIPDKLILAKMKQMVNKGIVSGCACGCNGNFFITEKGLDVLKNVTKP